QEAVRDHHGSTSGLGDVPGGSPRPRAVASLTNRTGRCPEPYESAPGKFWRPRAFCPNAWKYASRRNATRAERREDRSVLAANPTRQPLTASLAREKARAMRTVWCGAMAVFLSAMVAACSDTTAQCPGGAPGPIDTTSGDVCGTTVDVPEAPSAHAFLGIPYAETTAGENRWKPPIPAGRASGTLQAVAFGDICPQSSLGSAATDLALPPQSEDCLSVNVWTPADAEAGQHLPVLVYIHGGAFLFGSSANPIFDGAYLASAEHLVLVSLNYRVGAFGFLAGIDGLEGNYGFLDQQLALRWVRDNASAFGGDPEHVTIFGESAGAMSVGLHMLSAPSSAGLFVAGAMESNPFGLPYATVAQQGVKSARLAKALGCEGPDELDCLRAAPTEQIVAQQVSAAVILPDPRSLFQTLLPWVPVVDGNLIVAQPVAAASGGALEKPVLLGTNRNEGTSFVVAATTLGILPSPVTDQAYATTLALFFGAHHVAGIVERYPPMNDDNAD